jgi:DNA-binding XRE family transcriptional regulator
MRAHLRQEDLARAVGVSRKWIIDIEGGKERAELWMVLKTLQVLGLSLSISVNRSAESS